MRSVLIEPIKKHVRSFRNAVKEPDDLPFCIGNLAIWWARNEAVLILPYHFTDSMRNPSADFLLALDIFLPCNYLPAIENYLRISGFLRGRYEEMVPILMSEPLNDEFMAKSAGDPRNFDIFDFTCNGARVEATV